MSTTHPAIVLLWGADRGAILAALARLRETLVGGEAAAMAAFNHERFEAPYLRSFVPVVRACAQMPMMTSQRLIELSDPEELGKHARGQPDGEVLPTGDPLAALLDYVAEPNPTSVLAITSTGLRSTSKLVKAAAASPHAEARRFELPNADEAASAIAAVARERGVRLDRDAADVLVRSAGVTMGEVVIAFNKALAHAGTTHVRVADVQAVVRDASEPDVFALTDAIGRGDTKQSLGMLAGLFTKGESDVGAAQRLFGLLVRHFRLLFTAHAAGRNAARALGLPPFIANKYVAQAQATDERRLRRAYAGLARLDDDFKGGSALGGRMPYLLLQRWILDVCEALPRTQPR